jgi:hypothetical protein
MPKRMVVEKNVDTVEISNVSPVKRYVAEGDGYNAWLLLKANGAYVWLSLRSMCVVTRPETPAGYTSAYRNDSIAGAIEFATQEGMVVYQLDKLSEIQEFIEYIEEAR